MVPNDARLRSRTKRPFFASLPVQIILPEASGAAVAGRGGETTAAGAGGATGGRTVGLNIGGRPRGPGGSHIVDLRWRNARRLVGCLPHRSLWLPERNYGPRRNSRRDGWGWWRERRRRGHLETRLLGFRLTLRPRLLRGLTARRRRRCGRWRALAWLQKTRHLRLRLHACRVHTKPHHHVARKPLIKDAARAQIRRGQIHVRLYPTVLELDRSLLSMTHRLTRAIPRDSKLAAHIRRRQFQTLGRRFHQPIS